MTHHDEFAFRCGVALIAAALMAAVAPAASRAETPTTPLTIRARDGQVYTVPAPPPGTYTEEYSGVRRYFLAFNPMTAMSPTFNVVYSTDNSIIVSVAAKPLGATRQKAEKALRRFFPLTDAQLCSLDIQVLTVTSVDANLAGENLGLSFCPGSMALPLHAPPRRHTHR